ncbi:acyl-CoA dehydrogenase family protein [Leisingera thetidis]|uniref:acyl-CoA dehydrogenase family protein n=1 Tax=Leisingera thetidis TaxID=2930199 RepID=UPI0021F7946F|nr:acyl-CoA dehydrogenase family protein [Leisingera thetidis]
MPDAQLRQLDSLNDLLPALAAAADEMETNPEAWRQVWKDPRMRAVSFAGVPEGINPYPFREAGLGPDCGHALHLALVERLSRGAASAMMALPASALSTRAVLRLGTAEQITHFFQPFAEGEAWTFFGVTEPAVGSDAGQVRSVLQPHGAGWRLSGCKTLIGGATLARRGLVLAREQQTGVLRLVMIAQAADGTRFRARKLAAAGLMGAGISELQFDGFEAGPGDILAAGDRRPVMLTLSDVFEKHRPMVGAMALGTGRAMLDRLQQHRLLQGFDDLVRDHAALLGRMIRLGRQADHGPLPIHAVSQFKRQATALADAIRLRIARRAPDLILQDPRSRRLWRDAAAFEYMEGTSAIHRLNAYRDYLSGDVLNDLAV